MAMGIPMMETFTLHESKALRFSTDGSCSSKHGRMLLAVSSSHVSHDLLAKGPKNPRKGRCLAFKIWVITIPTEMMVLGGHWWPDDFLFLLFLNMDVLSEP